METKKIVKSFLLITAFAPSILFTGCDKEEKPTPSPAPTLTKVAQVDATCLKEGTLEHYKSGDTLYKDSAGTVKTTLSELVIPKLDLTLVEEKLPTYTEVGHKQHYKCEKCGKLFLDKDNRVEVPESSVLLSKYTFKSVKIGKQPTFYEEGSLEVTTSSTSFTDSKTTLVTIPRLHEKYYNFIQNDAKDHEDVASGKIEFTLKEEALTNAEEKVFFNEINTSIGSFKVEGYLPARQTRAIIIDKVFITGKGTILRIELKHGIIIKNSTMRALVDGVENDIPIKDISYTSNGENYMVESYTNETPATEVAVLIGQDYTREQFKRGDSIYNNFLVHYVSKFKAMLTSARHTPIFSEYVVSLRSKYNTYLVLSGTIIFTTPEMIMENQTTEVTIELENAKELVFVGEEYAALDGSKVVANFVVTEIIE